MLPRNFKMIIVPLSVTTSLLATGLIANAMWHHVVNSFSYQPPRIISRLDFKPIKLCYPTIKPEPSYLLSVQDGDLAYWEAHFQSFQKQSLLFFITSKNAEGFPTCSWLNRFKDGQRLDFLPEKVAVEFSSIHYRAILGRCEFQAPKEVKRKDEFCKANLRVEMEANKPTLFTEDVIALRTLKIGAFNATVPRPYQGKLSDVLPES
jgi:hypothetical protein